MGSLLQSLMLSMHTTHIFSGIVQQTGCASVRVYAGDVSKVLMC